MFTYPAKITKDIDVYLVSFRDFYGDEPVTQEESYEDALNIASDWLVTEASMAVERHEKLPEPTEIADGEVVVEMPISAQVKLLLFYEMLQQSVTGTELAKRMKIKRPSVQNIIKPDHATKIDTIQRAFKTLGKELVFELR